MSLEELEALYRLMKKAGAGLWRPEDFEFAEAEVNEYLAVLCNSAEALIEAAKELEYRKERELQEFRKKLENAMFGGSNDRR